MSGEIHVPKLKESVEGYSAAVQAIDAKIRDSANVADTAKYVTMRGDVLKQDEGVIASQRKYRLDALQVVANIAKSAFGLAAGTYLVTHEAVYPGMFVLGVSLFSVAPEFVMAYFKQAKGKIDGK